MSLPLVSYVVYMPHGPMSSPYSFSVSEDAKVQDLEDDIANHRAFKRHVADDDLILFKCDDLPIGTPSERFKRVQEWLRAHAETALMENALPLSEYFPSGPAPKEDKKIDVIAVTNKILDSVFGPITPEPLSQPVPFATEYSGNFHSGHRSFGWVIEPDLDWHKFYEFWSKQDLGRLDSLEEQDPFLTLVLDEKGYNDPAHRLQSLPLTNHRLYIRKEYRALVRTMRDAVDDSSQAAEALSGPERQLHQNLKYKGIVITGQPGSGKTTWLWYMLSRCLARRENVLFHYKAATRFFFEGRVYKAVENTPSWPKHPKCFAWSLIDADSNKNPPPVFVTDLTSNIFPVQASSPDDSRYAIWIKECQGRVWGMTLWNLDEMIEGLKIHVSYAPFMVSLHNAIVASVTAAQQGERADLHGFPETVQIAMQFSRDDKGQWLDTEAVFRRLVQDAMYNFGEVPRDVSNAVFTSYESQEKAIQGALTSSSVNYDKLFTALTQIGTPDPTSKSGSPSHQLFVIEPSGPDRHLFKRDDTFIPKFKSAPIGRKVMKSIGFLELLYAKKFLGVFRLFPESSQLAGWVFQSLACTMMGSADLVEGLVQMLTTGKNDKHIVFETPLNFSIARREPFPRASRDIVVCNFPSDTLVLTEGRHLERCLCVPAAPNHPLFDAFFVDMSISHFEVISTIWIVQTSIAHAHAGSATGYKHVRSIIQAVENRAREVYAESEGTQFMTMIRYLYVCPRPENGRKWNMPINGWDTVSGEVFCMHLTVNELPTTDVVNSDD